MNLTPFSRKLRIKPFIFVLPAYHPQGRWNNLLIASTCCASRLGGVGKTFPHPMCALSPQYLSNIDYWERTSIPSKRVQLRAY